MAITILVLVLHFIADFLLQSREMGQKKSSELKWLFKHLFFQISIFYLGLVFIYGAKVAWIFALSNAAVHGVIDWYIWRGYKLIAFYQILRISSKKYGYWTQPPEEDENVKKEIAAFKYWEDHWFYTTIGFDQLLHTLTLIILVGVIL